MIPPQANAEFVYHMEEVLDLYHEPYDPRYPLVCFDETSKQLISETRVPLPSAPGQVAHYDYEYERNGVRNLFLFCEPLLWLAAHQSHRTAHQGGLGILHEAVGG